MKLGKFRKKRTLLGCLIIFGLAIILFLKKGAEESAEKYPSTSAPFKILFWTRWYKFQADAIRAFVKPACHPEFIITTNKSEAETADVIIFSYINIHRNHGVEFPPSRNKDVPWILALAEASIQHPNKDLRRYDGLFNWTWSYRTDSLIHPNFTEMVEKKDERDERWIYGSEFSHNFLRSKTKVAAWVVSNCQPGWVKSKRNELTALLAAGGVGIDKYGGCGNVSCEKGDEKCFASLGTSYKFYLALENTLCEDYITEKISHGLLHGMLPVVYAVGNVGMHAPPNSFLNVLDFPTIGDLAERIKFLDGNPEEYFKYFEWRQRYHGNWTAFPRHQCYVWRKMKEYTLKIRSDPEEGPKYRHVYTDLTQWYSNFYNERLGEMCDACLSKDDIDIVHLSSNTDRLYNNKTRCNQV